MRYLVGFVFVLALGVMPVVGCGEETAEPCVEHEECDDGNPCTNDYCFGAVVSMRYCKNLPISCDATLPWPYESECATAEYDACDPEAPEGRVCGVITGVNGEGSCYPPYPGRWYCLFGSYECHGGNCVCSAD